MASHLSITVPAGNSVDLLAALWKNSPIKASFDSVQHKALDAAPPLAVTVSNRSRPNPNSYSSKNNTPGSGKKTSLNNANNVLSVPKSNLIPIPNKNSHIITATTATLSPSPGAGPDPRQLLFAKILTEAQASMFDDDGDHENKREGYGQSNRGVRRRLQISSPILEGNEEEIEDVDVEEIDNSNIIYESNFNIASNNDFDGAENSDNESSSPQTFPLHIPPPPLLGLALDRDPEASIELDSGVFADEVNHKITDSIADALEAANADVNIDNAVKSERVEANEADAAREVKDSAFFRAHMDFLADFDRRLLAATANSPYLNPIHNPYPPLDDKFIARTSIEFSSSLEERSLALDLSQEELFAKDIALSAV